MNSFLNKDSNEKKVELNNMKKRMIDDNYKCPISMKPIFECEKIGITSNAFVYNLDDIQKWLSKSNNCPMTNCKIPNFLIKIENNFSNVNDLVKKINEQILSCSESSVFHIPNIYIHKYKKYLETKDNHINKTNKEVINQKLDYIKTHDNLFAAKGFYQDISHLDLSNIIFNNKGFKCCNFSGCNLMNTTFFNCDVSRCQFYDCNLLNTRFINCKFWGEQVFFNFSKTNKHTYFSDCSIEPINAWNHFDNPKIVKQILINRGLTPIINNEFKVCK